MAKTTLLDSCCHRKQQHHRQCVGGKLTLEYKTYRNMMTRCYTKSNSRYPEYGAKGVVVCDRWRDSFQAFLSDMGPRPSPDHTIDRIDNNKGYSPDNCRWATTEQQNRNRSRNILITWRGKTQTATDWSKETGLSRWTITRRFRAGDTLDRVFSVATRRVVGTQTNTAKLTESQVMEIRRRGDAGESTRPLAKRFGVGKTIVQRIIARQSWKFLPEE